MGLLGPLHFGLLGAPWVEWFYFFNGFAPALLALTGVALLLLRHRRRTATA